MSSAVRPNLIAAGMLGFAAVSLGAFGAHALKEMLASSGHTATWQTAVLYHLIHSIALLGAPADKWTGRCWIAGIVLFSGSLYWLSLGGPRFLGPVTPLGGLFLLAGWVLVVWNAFKLPKT